MKYGVILADPPWHFEVWGEGAKRNASHHYNVQTTEWLCSLPIAELCAEDCLLFMWTCWPKLKDAMAVIDAWGFTYRTLGFDWVKVSSCAQPRIGMGYWTRANTEPCLLAGRGKPKRMDKGVSQVIVSGIGEHSQKPEQQYERIERLVEGPYVELFHRPRNGMFPPRDNWRFLGNECDGKDMADALRELAAEL